MRVIALEGGAVPRVVSEFSASEALAFLDAFLSFFLGEFFYADGVDVHSVWINFWILLVSVVSLNQVRVVGFL